MYNTIILLATLSFGVIGRFRKASKQNFKVGFQKLAAMSFKKEHG